MNPGWIDFARPSLGALIKSVQNDGSGGGSASKPHTASEIRSANEHATGNGHKRCTKGKACSATCIYINDDCLVGLPEPVSAAVSKVSRMLAGLVESGHITEEEAEIAHKGIFGQESGKENLQKINKNRAAEISRTYDAMRKEAKSDEEHREKMKYITGVVLQNYGINRDVSEKRVFSNEELNGLENNKGKINDLGKIYERTKNGEYKTQDEFNAALMPTAKTYRDQVVTPAMRDFGFALLPKSEQDYLLNKAGTVNQAGIFGKIVSTLTGNSGNGGKIQTLSPEQRRNRADLIWQIYLESRGRDIYDGKFARLTQMELEHIIPFKLAGPWAESGYNYGWTKTGYNRSKADRSPDYLLTNTLKKFRDSQGKDVEAFNAYKSRAKAASSPSEILNIIKGVNGASFDSREKGGILGNLLNSAYGVNKTFKSGLNPRGQDARVEWFKQPMGSKFLDAISPKLTAALESNNQKEVDRLISLTNSIPTRTQAKIEEKFGKNREGTSGSAPIFKEVVEQVMEKL
jgi:hypothetical protein